MEPTPINELLSQAVAEIGGEKLMHDAVLKVKCDLISDIIRVKRQSGCISRQHLIDIAPENIGDTFDVLYDQDVVSLELQLARLCAELTTYMRNELQKHNNGIYGPKLFDGRYWYIKDSNGNWVRE